METNPGINLEINELDRYYPKIFLDPKDGRKPTRPKRMMSNN